MRSLLRGLFGFELDGFLGGICVYSVRGSGRSSEVGSCSVLRVVVVGISNEASSFQVSLFVDISVGSREGISDNVSKRIFICSLIISNESVEVEDAPTIIGTSMYAITYC